MSRKILTGIVVVLVAFLSFCLAPIGGVISADVVPPVLNPDVNGDGYVNILDMVLVGQHWGDIIEIPPEEYVPPPWDVNGDGVVNVLDMVIIGQNWTG